MNLLLIILTVALALGGAWALAHHILAADLAALANAEPAVTFDPDNTVIGHTSILSFTDNADVPVTTDFRVKLLDYDGQNELLRTKFPDAGGVKRTRRIERVGSTEMFMVETSEYKKLVTLLAGKMTSTISGTAQLWIKDADDAADTVAVKTDAFPCELYRQNGSQRFAAEGGDDAGTKAVIVIESLKNGDVVLSIDAAA